MIYGLQNAGPVRQIEAVAMANGIQEAYFTQ